MRIIGAYKGVNRAKMEPAFSHTSQVWLNAGFIFALLIYSFTSRRHVRTMAMAAKMSA